MKRKIKVMVSPVVFSAFFSISAFADVFTWKEGAQGGWDDPLSYVNNAAAIPKDGDTVEIPDNVTAMANDDDMAVIAKLKNIRTLGANAKIVFDISKDYEIGCFISGTENGDKNKGDGIVEKTGFGALWLKCNSGIYNYYIQIIVNEGILRLQPTTYAKRSLTYKSLTVNHPGVLYTPVNSEDDRAVYFRAPLYGDGMVTNPAANYVVFYPLGNDYDNIPVFSGTLCGNIRISGSSGDKYQNFIGTGSLNAENISMGYGLNIGIYDFGGIGDGQTHYGSVGCGAIVFNGTGSLKYLGTGQDAYTTFQVNEDITFAHIDAGDTGGLRLHGVLDFSADKNKPLQRLVLSGNNTKDCTIEGTMNIYENGAVYLTKRGSGTWGLLSETAFKDGVIAVEDGNLKFSSIRNKGEKSSLGAANVLMSEHSGAVADAKPLPYAYLLGTADTLGTMEYVGGNEAVCDDRPFAVKGAGRVMSSGGTLVLAGGAGSIASGENTLYLGGIAPKCIMNNVTDGVGTLKVVKEGTGDWSLGGNLGFTGGIEVKEGVLTIGNTYDPGGYSRYRLTVRGKNESGGHRHFTIGRVALFNVDGEVQNAVLSYNPAANTKNVGSLLEPRQLAFALLNDTDWSPNDFYNSRKTDADGTVFYVDDPMANITNVFASLEATPDAYGLIGHKRMQNYSYWPRLEDEKTWPTIDFRLPAGSDPVVSYDIGTYYGDDSGKSWKSSIGSWTLYGSVDGKNWTELSSVTSNNLRGVATADCSWLSDGSSYRTAEGWKNHTSGWTIPARPEGSSAPVYSQFADGMGCVTVNSGAILCAKGEYKIDELELSSENGTIDGFSFASSGTLKVSGTGGSDKVHLPVTFLNASGLANLKNWDVDCDERKFQIIKADENGVVLSIIGLKVVVR